MGLIIYNCYGIVWTWKKRFQYCRYTRTLLKRKPIDVLIRAAVRILTTDTATMTISQPALTRQVAESNLSLVIEDCGIEVGIDHTESLLSLI